jgi:ABC-2 type transport system permease protein
VRDAELIIGKWLGGFLFMLTIIAVTLIFPLILNNLVDPSIDQRLMMTSYLGVILVSAAFLGLGVGVSALFTSPVAAFFVTLVTFIFFWWLIGFPADLIPAGGNVFNYLNMQSHFYDTLNRGVIQLGDLVYFISLTVLGLFVGTTAVEFRRWR